MRPSRCFVAIVAIGVAALVACLCVPAVEGVWPPPRHYETAGRAGSLCVGFSVSHNLPSSTSTSLPPHPPSPKNPLESHTASWLIDGAIDRMVARLKLLNVPMTSPSSPSSSTTLTPPCVAALHLNIDSEDSSLGMDTVYDYTLSLSTTSTASASLIQAHANSSSVFGAMYALETFAQLAADGLLHEYVDVRDVPQHAWRGLMLDSGRRFFPVSLVENILDSMAAVKLNVLHLHASDMCRFGVQSHIYPNLTDALTGILGGYYTQSDIAHLVSYAGARGIRVMPEFDVPGHSRGFIPVEAEGAVFCNADASRSQLYGDPANRTFTLLHALFHEMSALFPDNVFHIGCDETGVVGPCTLPSTFALERAILNTVQQEFNKTPAGWEEVYFNAGAATPGTIVFTWSRHHPAEVTATGRRAVENAGEHFYLTRPAPAGPAGWSTCWYDIETGVPESQLSLVLGGELSMWSDTYCYTDQCGASQGSTPDGAALFPPAHDAAFSQSVGGMIFPRALVGAAAFWNYNSSVDPGSADFVAGINNLTRMLQGMGQYVCPVDCYCDQLTACGVPYLQAKPDVGMTVGLSRCQAGVELSTQRWSFTEEGKLALVYNTSLCVEATGSDTYPVVLTTCDKATVFRHTAQAQFISTTNGQCLDVREADSAVGIWECGANQPNQMWGFDNSTHLLASLGTYPPGSDTMTKNVEKVSANAGDNKQQKQTTRRSSMAKKSAEKKMMVVRGGKGGLESKEMVQGAAGDGGGECVTVILPSTV